MAKKKEADSDLAISLLEQAREMDPTYYPVLLDLAEIMIDNERLEEAQGLLREIPVSAEVSDLMARLNFSLVAAKAPPLETLESTLAENPSDLMARYQLSARKVLDGDFETAMAHLLELMRRDRGFEDDAGRKGLVAVFGLLGNQGPLVSRYRGKMSALLY